MLRCLLARGTEPTPGARAQEAARLISQFVGDLCVVAQVSEDRRTFGPCAGLGSFSSLRALPVDYLKIDGQFVGGLAGNPVDREIVKAIVALARAAGRRTVAEFVSDQDTLELLTALGVDLAQGFHVGRPRPLEEL